MISAMGKDAKKLISLQDVLKRRDGKNPWDLLPGELEEHYRCFRFYLECEPKDRTFAVNACRVYCRTNKRQFG